MKELHFRTIPFPDKSQFSACDEKCMRGNAKPADGVLWTLANFISFANEKKSVGVFANGNQISAW
jgi:hypothetical protein